MAICVVADPEAELGLHRACVLQAVSAGGAVRRGDLALERRAHGVDEARVQRCEAGDRMRRQAQAPLDPAERPRRPQLVAPTDVSRAPAGSGTAQASPRAAWNRADGSSADQRSDVGPDRLERPAETRERIDGAAARLDTPDMPFLVLRRSRPIAGPRQRGFGGRRGRVPDEQVALARGRRRSRCCRRRRRRPVSATTDVPAVRELRPAGGLRAVGAIGAHQVARRCR